MEVFRRFGAVPAGILAATAVAARWLARSGSSILGILGWGVQGRTNTEALQLLFPLGRVMAYDVSPEAVESFAQRVSAELDLEVVPVDHPREAVTDCDLVVTAGPILKRPHATIQAGWLDVVAFASLVDFDSYRHPAALREADKFCTDDLAQGEHYRQVGCFQDIPPIHAHLGELDTSRKPGRQAAGERTMTCNLGLALDDMAAGPTL